MADTWIPVPVSVGEEFEARRVEPPETLPRKTCSACRQVKPLTQKHFRARRKSSDGFTSQCKKCLVAARKRQIDPERHNPKPCDECHDLPWRRDRSGCSLCRERYGEESPVELDGWLGASQWSWITSSDYSPGRSGPREHPGVHRGRDNGQGRRRVA